MENRVLGEKSLWITVYWENLLLGELSTMGNRIQEENVLVELFAGSIKSREYNLSGGKSLW